MALFESAWYVFELKALLTGVKTYRGIVNSFLNRAKVFFIRCGGGAVLAASPGLARGVRNVFRRAEAAGAMTRA